MYDIDELEKEWEGYRRRRVLRYAGGGAVATVIVILLAVFATRETPPETETNQTATSRLSAERNGSSGKAKAHIAVLGSEVPSMYSPGKGQTDSDAVKKRPKLNIQVTDIPDDEKTEEPESEESGKSQSEKSNMQKREDVIKEMERRFAQSKDYDEALYIARYYYAKKEYKKAERWAMQANTIDSKKEDSWIIFGKAKAKQGDRIGSLKVLQAYFDKTGSERAGELIDKIRKGNPF
jgi:tetratricopeptide (TPR) repeat protein